MSCATHPEGRSFMFNDINLQGCRSVTELAPLCDGIRAAMRSGDPQKCASLGKLESICRAYVTLDTKLCKSGDPNDPYAKNAAADCVKKIQSKAVLAKGLKELAASGPPRERELAKAALGQADACASLEQEAVKACAAATPVPPPPPPAGTSPAAGQTPDARPAGDAASWMSARSEADGRRLRELDRSPSPFPRPSPVSGSHPVHSSAGSRSREATARR